MKELNVNKLAPDDFIFSIVITVNNSTTPSITEYSAINEFNAFLLLKLIVQNTLITVAIKTANKKFAIFEDNAKSTAIYINII